MKKSTKINFLFYIPLLAVVGITLATPHIMHNLGFIDDYYAQSLVILLGMTSTHVLFLFYRKKTKELKDLIEEKSRYEQRLNESFKYIGKNNAQKEITASLMNNLKKYQNGTLSRKKIFALFLSSMIISAAKANKGMLRFISLQDKQTVKDFYYSVDGKQLMVNLSNSQALAGRLEKTSRQNYDIIESDFEFGGLKCVLVFSESGARPNKEMLQTLINQAHLFFVASNTGA